MSRRSSILAAVFAMLALAGAQNAAAQSAFNRGSLSKAPATSNEQARVNTGAVGLTVDDLKKDGWDCTKLIDGYYCTKSGQTPKACTPDGKTCALTANRNLSPVNKGSTLKAQR